jgi:hypothetical protein
VAGGGRAVRGLPGRTVGTADGLPVRVDQAGALKGALELGESLGDCLECRHDCGGDLLEVGAEFGGEEEQLLALLVGQRRGRRWGGVGHELLLQAAVR